MCVQNLDIQPREGNYGGGREKLDNEMKLNHISYQTFQRLLTFYLQSPNRESENRAQACGHLDIRMSRNKQILNGT